MSKRGNFSRRRSERALKQTIDGEPFETYDRWIRKFYLIIDRPLPEFAIYLTGPERIEIVLNGLGEADVAEAVKAALPFFLPVRGRHWSVTAYAVPVHTDLHADLSGYDE